MAVVVQYLSRPQVGVGRGGGERRREVRQCRLEDAAVGAARGGEDVNKTYGDTAGYLQERYDEIFILKSGGAVKAVRVWHLGAGASFLMAENIVHGCLHRCVLRCPGGQEFLLDLVRVD